MFSNSSTVILLYRNAICLVWTSCFWISYALLFISMYFICLPYHVLFFTLKCCSSGLLQCHLSFPIIHAYVALVFFCMYSASIQFNIQVVFLHCFPIVSLALTSYSLGPDYKSQKWIQLDVSKTKIRLDPSIYFRMEGIHVNMSCLSILQYLFHLFCSMFYNWSTILLYKACKGKTAMLESEGLQTRSLQKIQMPGDKKQTQFFIDAALA